MFSDKYVVEPLCDDQFNVVNGTKNHLVDLAKRICECCEFQLELVPCSHFLNISIKYANYAVSVFVDDFYDNTHLKGM
ncbi:hypothetical protein ACS0TY_030239 [Phlomoides rotata]